LLTRFSENEKAIQLQVANTLAHAAVPSSRAWIAEGLAHYAQVREKEVQEGRKAAVDFLLDRLTTLALDEPENIKSAPDSAARSLINTGDEVLYRTKSMYVWWMLHEMLGDDPITKALRNYREADDKEATYMQKLLEAQAHRDLGWFFNDWVYRDRGLPDFRVVQVYPRQTLESRYIVTVTVENLGDCAAEVPIRVFTREGETTTRVLVMGKEKGSARLTTASLPLQVIVNDGGVPESDIGNNLWKTEEKKKTDKPE
jgi:aminopeptidase N